MLGSSTAAWCQYGALEPGLAIIAEVLQAGITGGHLGAGRLLSDVEMGDFGRESSILLGQSCVTPPCRMDSKVFRSVSLCALPGLQCSYLRGRDTQRLPSSAQK